MDEDETITSIGREAEYYGVNVFCLRITTILVFLAISLMFTNVGWAVYESENITPQVILGLRILMKVFPIIALIIGFLSIYKNPLDGERLKNVKEKLEVLHNEKKSKI
jgi:Na+/melibiose symporter-like transporter